MKKLLLVLFLASGMSMVGQTKVLLSVAGEKVNYVPLPRGTADQFINGEHQLGDFSTAVQGVTTVTTASAVNTMTVTVNGVAADVSAGQGRIIHLVENSVSGTSLVTTVNGIAAQAIDLSGAVSGGIQNDLVSPDNTITSTVNGDSATATLIKTVTSQIVNGTELEINVNGVADGTPVDLTPLINTAVAATHHIEEFPAGAGDVSFTLGHNARAASPFKMYINGVKIKEDALAITGSAAAYTSANNYGYTLQAGDIVTIAYQE